MNSFKDSKQLLFYLAENGVIASKRDSKELFNVMSNIIDKEKALSILGGFIQKENESVSIIKMTVLNAI